MPVTYLCYILYCRHISERNPMQNTASTFED